MMEVDIASSATMDKMTAPMMQVTALPPGHGLAA
jgi:hypothetical protein